MSPFLCVETEPKQKILLRKYVSQFFGLGGIKTVSKAVGFRSQFGDIGQKLKGHPPNCVCQVIIVS